MRRRCHNRQGWPADIATSWIDSPNLGDTAKRASLVPVHHGVVNMDSIRQGNPIQFRFTSQVSPGGVDEDRSVHTCSVGDGGFMPTLNASIAVNRTKVANKRAGRPLFSSRPSNDRKTPRVPLECA